MVQLRPYQRDAHSRFLDFLDRGGKRGIIQLPTGCGKTVTGLTLAKKMEAKTLWIAHRTELITQPLKTTKSLFPDVTTGIVKARKNEMDSDFVFASIQSLYRRVDQLPKFDLVVVDECHHTPSKTYRTVLESLGDTPVLGLTATPERGDGKGLDEDFEEIVYQLQLLEAIKAGYLADLRSKQIDLGIRFDKIRTTAGDLNAKDLNEEMLRVGVPEGVADAYIKHARDKKGIIFTVSVDQAKRTTSELLKRGIRAEWVSGSIKEQEREAILKRLNTGETQVVVNCMVLTEGFDEPSVECVVIARPTKSKPLYLQMIGRGSRLAPGKKECLILDVTGVSKRHSLVTVPVLFGTKSGESVKEKDERERKEREQRDLEIIQLKKIATKKTTEEEDEFDWLKVNDNLYVMDCGDIGQLRVRKVGNDWIPKIKRRGDFERKISNPTWLELAKEIGEDYIRRVNPNILRLVGKNAEWKKHPASDSQKNLLKKYGVPFDPNITKGEAAKKITLLFAK